MNKVIFKILFLAFIGLGSSSFAQNDKEQSNARAQYPSLFSYYYNYKARKALENKNPELALEYTLRILELEPQAAQIHSNLAVVFDYLQKKDESEKSHQQAFKILESHVTNLRQIDAFQIFYNLGVYYGAQKKIDQALQFYQRALDIDPTSIETKHNIELLIQSQQQQQQQQQQNGQSQNQDQKDNQDQQKKDPQDKKDNKDKKDQDKKDDKDQSKKEQDQNKDRSQTPKYQPRPFKGDQLSEGDVKKILGELSEQDKKIRANFNKKERKEGRNDKDW